MKLTFLLFLIILPSLSWAQLNEQTCFCANPVDCEIGTVECAYKTTLDGQEFSGLLTARFVSGDDPSPETGASDLRVYNVHSRFNAGFFASSCSTKNFRVDFQIHAYRFTTPGDFNRWEYILGNQVISFEDLDFMKTPQTKKLSLPGLNFTADVTCLGRPN